MKVKENVQIAYIGGGSRGGAWGLMSDLAQAEDISGEVRLYDIDKQAAYNNTKKLFDEMIENTSKYLTMYK